MRELRNYFLGYFTSFGFSTLLYTMGMQIVAPQKYSIKFIWALAVMLAINITCGRLMFRPGLSKSSLWVRRTIVIGVACITTPGTVILFGAIDASRVSYFEYVRYSIAIILVLSVIVYVIADRIEQRKLDMINNKLDENK